jgi:hypothetical protein
MEIYIMYAVAKVKQIPMLILTPTGIRKQRVWGESIEEFGRDIETDYLVSLDTEILTGKVLDYYNKSLQRQNESALSAENKEKQRKIVYKFDYSRYDKSSPQFYRLKRNVHMLATSILKHHNLQFYREHKVCSDDVRRMYQVKLYQKYDAVTLKQYDKQAVLPVKGEKYIYYPMHQTPEATILPLGGEFMEQYNAIQILSRAAEQFEVKIYVKDYYVQPSRERYFWDTLRQLSNVRLIKSSVPSDELIEGCVATATLTGTVMLESVFENKPVLAFGGCHYWKGMPGVYEVDSEETCKALLADILERGISIPKEQIKRYFASISRRSLEYNIDLYYQASENPEEYEVTLIGLKALLEEKCFLDKQ